MLTWLKRRRGTKAAVRHCRECGAVVPAGAGLCPRCHSMDIEDGPPNKGQQQHTDGRAPG
jgi:ribosomal protein L40E